MRQAIRKPETVVLATRSGYKKEFEVQHAERILDMGEELNGGWHLPENNKYMYDSENGLRVKSDKGNS